MDRNELRAYSEVAKNWAINKARSAVTVTMAVEPQYEVRLGCNTCPNALTRQVPNQLAATCLTAMAAPSVPLSVTETITSRTDMRFGPFRGFVSSRREHGGEFGAIDFRTPETTLSAPCLPGSCYNTEAIRILGNASLPDVNPQQI